MLCHPRVSELVAPGEASMGFDRVGSSADLLARFELAALVHLVDHGKYESLGRVVVPAYTAAELQELAAVQRGRGNEEVDAHARLVSLEIEAAGVVVPQKVDRVVPETAVLAEAGDHGQTSGPGSVRDLLEHRAVRAHVDETGSVRALLGHEAGQGDGN